MFESSNQIYVTLTCFSLGVIFGLIYLIVIAIKQRFTDSIIKILIDVFFFVLLVIFYFVVSYNLKFPSIRVYMPTSVLFGVFCSIKSFNLILAKICKKLYNKMKVKPRKKV